MCLRFSPWHVHGFAISRQGPGIGLFIVNVLDSQESVKQEKEAARLAEAVAQDSEGWSVARCDEHSQKKKSRRTFLIISRYYLWEQWQCDVLL